MSQQIQQKDKPEKSTSGCKYQNFRTWPLPWQCLTEGVIYGAKVTQTNTGKAETYTGLCDPFFKSIYGSHLSTFTH